MFYDKVADSVLQIQLFGSGSDPDAPLFDGSPDDLFLSEVAAIESIKAQHTKGFAEGKEAVIESEFWGIGHHDRLSRSSDRY